MDTAAGLGMLVLISAGTDPQPLLAQLSLSPLLLPKKMNFLVQRSLLFPIDVWGSGKLRVNVSPAVMELDGCCPTALGGFWHCFIVPKYVAEHQFSSPWVPTDPWSATDLMRKLLRCLR